MDWKKEIAIMALVKSEIARADTRKLWPYHFARAAATPAQLAAVESHLGYAVNEEYAHFMRHANGWEGFYQTVQLFGTDELLGNAAMENALRTIGYLEDSVLTQSGVARDRLLPIAATFTDMDLFVIDRSSAPAPGPIIWFAGSEIERFSSFSEFFLAMVDYNRRELAALQR